MPLTANLGAAWRGFLPHHDPRSGGVLAAQELILADQLSASDDYKPRLHMGVHHTSGQVWRGAARLDIRPADGLIRERTLRHPSKDWSRMLPCRPTHPNGPGRARLTAATARSSAAQAASCL